MKNRTRIVAVVATLLVGATLTQPLTGLPVLPEQTAHAFGCPTPISILNGSFEQPVLPANNATTPPGWQNLSLGGWYIPDGQIPGWSTTASDGLFELWKSGRRGVPAAAGAQFAEDNANVPGTVFQSIDTAGLQGQTLTFSFSHRGRNGVDTMKIEIGPTGGTPNFTQNYSTGNADWVTYTGSYTVPVGQTSTRFGYGAVSAVGGATLGNFIDNITFGTPPCATDLAVAKTATPSVYVPGQPVTFTIAITNTGAFPGQYDVVGATLSDTVPAAITGVSWTCTASAGSACGAASGTGNAMSTAYNILEGGTVTYTVTGTAPVSVPPPALSNTATVALPPGVTDTNPSNNTSTASLPRAEASLNLVKSSDSLSVPFPGTITFSFSVTNDGDVPLTNVTVTDPRIGTALIDCDGDNVIATLPVGATVVCTAAYTTTVADLLGFTNTASVTATPPPGLAAPTDTSTMTTPFDPAPAVTVVKSSDAAEPVSAGDVITYSFAVTNTGNVPLDDVTVTDDRIDAADIDCGGGDDNVIESMVPGGPITCTATYKVTQADVDTGSITNTVTVIGTPVTGGEVTATDDLTIDTDDAATAASLVKTADVTNPAVGDVVTYSFEVANTGNVTLTGVRVTDPLPGLSPVDCGSGNNLIVTLAPADPPVTCTAMYTVTQADIDRGGITNAATATGTPPPGSPPLTPPQSGTGVPITRDPAVQVVKSTDAMTDLVVGQLITYTLSVSNTGNVTLRNVAVTDTLVAPSAINCDGDNVITSIAPGAPPVECTATYTVIQADADAGFVDNTVTVTATPPAGLPNVSDSDTVTSPIDPAPELALVKTADGPDPVTLGDVIDYSFAVTNTGNVTLTDVTVTDELAGLTAIDCGGDGDNVIESFAPGGPITCTASYTVTQADMDAGSVSNTATATATPPPGSPPLTPPTDTVDVPIDRTASLSIVKSSDVAEPEPLLVDDVVTFEFSVTNAGNTTLTNVTVTDVLDGLSPISCAGGTNVIATMDPGDNVECTATYTVTQDDVDNGVVLNEATVTGTPPAGLDPPSDIDDHATPFPPMPGIELAKSADFTAPLTAGDEITYTIAVTNSGNVSLTGVTVTDDLVDESAIDCGTGTNVIARMAPGGPRLCTVTYTVTQDDIDGGGVTNTASVSGQPPFGLPPQTDDSTVDVPIAPQPALALDKSSAADEQVAVGDVIEYSFEVTNTGNVTLSNVTVTDPLLGDAGIDCGDGTNVIATLTPADGPITCTATYTVTQADVDNGNVTNFASATGTPPGSDEPLTPVNDTTTVDVEQISAMTLVKSSDAGADVAVGDEITYSFTVDNTGTVTLTGVTVSDPLVGLSAIDCGDGTPTVATLLPDDPPLTCTATYTVTQADVDNGTVTNTATASGSPPEGAPPLTPPTSTVDVPIERQPALTLVKSAQPPTASAAGNVITYSFLVTNSGNVTIADITVTDELVGLSSVDCGDGTPEIASLAPDDEPVTCTATYTVTQADVDNGSVTNTATATGTPPAGSPPLTPAESTTNVPIAPGPALSLTKTSDADEPVSAGDEITYSLAVDNTGNVTLNDVTVTDDLDGLSAINCGAGSPTITTLAPADPPVTCTATYTVTQIDIDAGAITNTASVTGTPPGGGDPIPPATDTLTVDADQAAALTLAKTAEPASAAAGGDVITYFFEVANTGTVTLTNVTVSDPLTGLSAIDCGDDSPTIATLSPTDPPVRCTATYTVTQADVDDGGIENTATATGTPPPGAPPLTPAQSTAEVSIPTSPALSLDKTDNAGDTLAAGDVITYSFNVVNTGNATLTTVTVSDPLVGDAAIDCGDGTPTIASLAPADDPVTCTATYTVTAEDVEVGSITNTAAVTGTPPGGGDPITTTDTNVVEVPQVPALSLVKSATPSGGAVAGDTLSYTFAVTNTGNVTLSAVTITDPLAGLSAIDCGGESPTIATIVPGGSATCSATYTVTQADVDSGSIDNTATASGTDPNGDPATADGSVNTPLQATGGIRLDKTAGGINDVDGNGVDLGDTITYFFLVTNTGALTLDDVTVDDPMLGGNVACGSGPLAPGEGRSCAAVVFTLGEGHLGTMLRNAATARGTSGGSVLSHTGTALTLVPPACSVTSTTTTSSTSTTTSTTTTTPTTVADQALAPPITDEQTSTTTTELVETTVEPPAEETTTSTTVAETTPTTTTTEPPVQGFGLVGGAAGESRLLPRQVDPCAVPPTTTTTLPPPPPPPPSPGGGGGAGGGSGGSGDGGAPSGGLPATGSDHSATVAYATALIACGLGTLVLVRRRSNGS